MLSLVGWRRLEIYGLGQKFVRRPEQAAVDTYNILKSKNFRMYNTGWNFDRRGWQ